MWHVLGVLTWFVLQIAFCPRSQENPAALEAFRRQIHELLPTVDGGRAAAAAGVASGVASGASGEQGPSAGPHVAAGAASAVPGPSTTLEVPAAPSTAFPFPPDRYTLVIGRR